MCAIGKLVLRGTGIVVPKELRSHVLELAHEGHAGIMAMEQLLRSKVWWPRLDKDAERVCKTCHGCHLVETLRYDNGDGNIDAKGLDRVCWLPSAFPPKVYLTKKSYNFQPL